MQTQWNENFKKMQEKAKMSNEKVKKQFEDASNNMKQFFQNQQQQMNEFFQKADAEIQTKNDQNRDKFVQTVSNMSQGWSNFVHSQQVGFEKTLGSINRAAWRTQLNFIMCLIPILIIIILIFTVLRPLLTFS
jgi:hypothetical protein